MTAQPILGALRGPFNFLVADGETLERALRDLADWLPPPVPLARIDEPAPIRGLPVRKTARGQRLRLLLERAIEQEERRQIAAATAGSAEPLRDPEDGIDAWREYAEELGAALRNIATYNLGRRYASVFWLYHSHDLVRALRGTPRRIREVDLELGKEQGDRIRFQVLARIGDRVRATAGSVANRDLDRAEERRSLTHLLDEMRRNVLILTEDYISRDLSELASFFRGVLGIDGRDTLYRIALLRAWALETMGADAQLRAVGQALLEADDPDIDRLLFDPRFLRVARHHPRYSVDRLLDDRELELWNDLALRLQRFELLQSLRRLVVEVGEVGGQMVCDGRAASRLGAGSRPLVLAAGTRPFDFFADWIVDPEVSRAGLVYDLCDFSATVSSIELRDRAAQNASFRQIFLFQRGIDDLAAAHRARREKYLGDGAFYSARDPWDLLALAILAQREYGRAQARGFAFDQGLRIALNYGSYRLLPLERGATGEERFEVFGQGLVELTRMVSGKRGWDLDEIRTILVTAGFEQEQVDALFRVVRRDRPSATRHAAGAFRASLGTDGSLVNDGIVASERFLVELTRRARPRRAEVTRRESETFLVIEHPTALDPPLRIGLRRLGVADLKGLGGLSVVEVLDAAAWEDPVLRTVGQPDLVAELQRLYAARLRSAPAGAGEGGSEPRSATVETRRTSS